MKTLSTLIAAPLLGLATLLLAGCGGGSGGNLPVTTPPATPLSKVATPLALPGPHAVGCSNVAQNLTRLHPDESATDYWKGSPAANGTARYVTDLLADPVHTLTFTLTAPDDAALYGPFAGNRIPYALLICYPTAADNPNADYSLPNGVVVPHMQTGASPPLLKDANVMHPVILFSHGIGGSPLSGGYLPVISLFASYGYVVVAPFHGDQRFLADDDLGNAISLLAHEGPFNALQSLRPLSMSAAIDLVLSHPQWRDHIDAARIGGFGVSIGGETLMLMGGAGLTTSADLSWSRTARDPRLKAAVGYLPYFGAPLLPAFGRDQNGLNGVTLPYLAISGSTDTTAPLGMAEKGMAKLAGTRELVVLNGESHALDDASIDDLLTWSLTFLDALVRGDAAAARQLSAMTSAAGGADDSVAIPYNGTGSQ